jgi:hypothetical protein
MTTHAASRTHELCQQALIRYHVSPEEQDIAVSFAVRTSEVGGDTGGQMLTAKVPVGAVEHLPVVQLLTMLVTSAGAVLLVVETMRATRANK